MTKEFANTFAKLWIQSWNSHDIDKILSHYSEDFSIESPMAIKLYPESLGFVIGKSEVRKYWIIGLERSPNLQFKLLDLLVGVKSISLYLFNFASNKRSVELMSFNPENLVSKAIVTFSE